MPDTAAAFTLEALGYAPDKAAWKARRQGQYVRNKITRALSEAGIGAPDALILDGQALARKPDYQELLEQVERSTRLIPLSPGPACGRRHGRWSAAFPLGSG
nr:tRNA-dependent cyclodipeptide synthase [Streptomyces halobius]